MPEPRQVVAGKQLLVEGVEAERFFSALVSWLNLQDVQVQNFGGIDELRRFLKAFRNVPGFSRVLSLGIARDAEEDPRGAFQSVQTALRNAGLASPAMPSILEGDRPRVAVLILPNATTLGMLEDLCLQAVADKPAISCVDEYFECVRQRTGLEPRNRSKARLHAFLASCTRPGLRLGEAADAGYIPWTSAAFEGVRNFLQML